MKTEITPENEYTVPIPALNPSLCINPDTLVLSFKFTNSNTKSWFLNNLGRTIVERLSVRRKHDGSLQGSLDVGRRP